MSKFLEQCKKWHLSPVYDGYCVFVEGGDRTARNHFNTLLQREEYQIAAQLELYVFDEALRYDVDERIAIDEIDYGFSCDKEKAIRVNLRILADIISKST